MNAREQALKAHWALLNGSGKLSYFLGRGISEEVVKRAYVGYEAGAFTYPCIAKVGGLLGIHYKGEGRDDEGKRKQWWDSYTVDLPSKGHGKNPDALAKVVPFGLETLKDLAPGSLVVLCCGEEDALSLRQAGYVAVSQPGAGLLEPIYARELAGFEVVVFYDAGEEREARKDALKLSEAEAQSVRVAGWPPEAPNGADINGKLAKDPKGFEGWAAKMIEAAKSLAAADNGGPSREGDPDRYDARIIEPQPWPVLAEEALHGLPGEIVDAIEPHTEADRVALLASLLCAFGNAIGRGAFKRVGADVHHLRIYAALVWQTSKARKGTSWGFVRELMGGADSLWASSRVQNGLSSGEGLIHAVRDPVERTNNKTGDTEVVDEGVVDKRLLVVEAELASTLKMMARDGNTLSPVVRQAWDGDLLQVMTRNSPSKATNSHVSVLGHITREELLRHLTETETANGFANRFLWFMVRRSKLLPFGGEWWKLDKGPLVRRLESALHFGRKSEEISWGESTGRMWEAVYESLSEGKPGLFGAVTGRAEAQVIRLAALYAVMDRSRLIETQHLKAALALWEYAEESARYVFGDATGDAVADDILTALQGAGDRGMTRTEIRDYFGRNQKSERVNRALALLLKSGRIRREVEPTGGRPVERWFLA